MKKRSFTRIAPVLLLSATPSLFAAVLVEDDFDGFPGTEPDSTKFEWAGEVTRNGTGQINLQTWSVNQSWLRSKAGAVAADAQPLVLQLRAYAYAEDWTPGVYGDQQPRGLRSGGDPNNAIEFYSLSRSSVGLRTRKDGVESLADCALPAGVDSMHDYEISVTTTSAVFKVDGVVVGTFTTNLPAGALNVFVSTSDGGAGNVPVTLDSLSLSQAGPPAFEFYTNAVDGTITIERYIGTGGAVIIPGSINNRPVSSLGQNAFYSCAAVTSVTVPDSVTSIGDTAFVYCTGLAAATIGRGVTNIGYHAFFGCSGLTALTVDPSNPAYSSVDGILFDREQVTLVLCPGRRTGSYTIPGTVTTIANGAFDHCTSLASVIMPDSVTNVGAGAFYSCTSLTNAAIGNRVVTLGNLAFYSCTSLTNVTIPDSVTSISGAFSDCTGLVNVSLGSGLTDITGAFVRCASLASIVIPAGVGSVGYMAFAGCTSLASVSLPATLGSLGDGAFSDCRNLPGIALPESVTSIGDYAFEYCTALNGLTIPNSVTNLGRFAFKNCSSFVTLAIPDSVTVIGEGILNQCTGLTSVTIGKGVPAFASWAFTGCSNLTVITVDPLNPTISSLDGVLFDKNRTALLKFPEGKSGSYLIPDTVLTIGNFAFQNNARLASVTVPGSVTNIGSLAFAGCKSLTSVYFQGNAPGVDPSAFVGICPATIYYLPGTTGWGAEFASRPAVLWNPRPLSNEGTFGVQNNQFGFTIAGSPDLVVVVEACTDLANPAWSPVSTNTLTGGTSYFSDAEWTNYPTRLYRLRSL